MINAFRCARFSINLARTVDGNLVEKMRKVAKYCPQYHYHIVLQQKIMKNNLEQYRKAKSSQRKQGINYYKSIMGKYFEIRRKIIEKSEQNIQQLKDQNLRESAIKNLMKQGFEKLSLFYESLQALVEGRREVLQNEQYVFEDGKSVKQKRQNFEKTMQRFFGKKISQAKEKSETLTQQ